MKTLVLDESLRTLLSYSNLTVLEQLFVHFFKVLRQKLNLKSELFAKMFIFFVFIFLTVFGKEISTKQRTNVCAFRALWRRGIQFKDPTFQFVLEVEVESEGYEKAWNIIVWICSNIFQKLNSWQGGFEQMVWQHSLFRWTGRCYKATKDVYLKRLNRIFLFCVSTFLYTRLQYSNKVESFSRFFRVISCSYEVRELHEYVVSLRVIVSETNVYNGVLNLATHLTLSKSRCSVSTGKCNSGMSVAERLSSYKPFSKWRSTMKD